MAAQAVPTPGYVMFQTFLSYEGLVYQPAPSPATEIVWPDKSGVNVRYPGTANGHEGWVHHQDLSQGLAAIPSQYEGSLVEILLTCSTGDRWFRFSLLPYDEVSLELGSFLKLMPAELPVAVDGAIYVHCDPTFLPPAVGGLANAPEVGDPRNGKSIRGWLVAGGTIGTLALGGVVCWVRRRSRP